MPVRRNITSKDGTYFITFTCTNWIPLFEITQAYDSVYNWFNVLKNDGHNIIGYVIMPNHLHTIISFKNLGKSINIIVSNGKRFIAYDIVKKLGEQKNTSILNQLRNARNASEIKANKNHKVFQTSFDWKCCESDKFVEQKLQYIHSNPCKGKWNLVDSSIDYLHCSATYYLTGVQGVYEVKNYKALADE